MAMDRDNNLDIVQGEGREHVTPREKAVGEAAYLGISRAAWPAIWAGFFIGTITYLVLNVFGAALGISWVSDDQVSRGALQTAAGIWLVVTTLISFFVGGFVTGRMSSIPGHGTGAMNGLLYGAFAMIVTAVFSLIPAMAGIPFVTSLFSSMGGGLNMNMPNMPNVNTDHAQAAAWWTFIGLVVALAAATLGGWTGARHAHVDPLVTGGTDRHEAHARRRAAI